MTETTPEIRALGEPSDFHDCSLLGFELSQDLTSARVVVSIGAPEEAAQAPWLLEFSGLLRIEFETSGSGVRVGPRIPADVYAIYRERGSDEERRWSSRLNQLEGTAGRRDGEAMHIVLASSTARGWGERRDLEGISILCREVQVRPAPERYDEVGFRQPRIEGA